MIDMAIAVALMGEPLTVELSDSKINEQMFVICSNHAERIYTNLMARNGQENFQAYFNSYLIALKRCQKDPLKADEQLLKTGSRFL